MRGLAGAAVSAALLAVAVVFPGTGAAPAVAEDATTSRAFAEVAGCLSGGDVLLADLVVDSSLSLRSTDPSAARVGAVVAAVDSLAELQRSAGKDLRVEVAMATFARSYQRLVGWAPLTAAHADRLRMVARGELPRADDGDATDYRQALNGARSDLTGRAEALHGRTVCKVLLWFTDGGLDVEGQTGLAARELCQPGGIVDAVREADINIITLALFTPGSDAVPAEQRDQLRAVTEGTGARQSCGTVPLRSDVSAGAYLPASDVRALRMLFAGSVARISGGTQGGTLTCPGPACPRGRAGFRVDPGLAGFRLVIDGNAAGPAQLVGPDGRAIPLTGGTLTVPGGAVTVSTRDGLTTASVTFEAATGPQVGPWQLVPAPAGAALTADLFWFWGARAVLPNDARVVKGHPATLQVRLSVLGRPLSPALYRSVEVSAQLDGRSVPLRPGATEGTYEGTVTVPEADPRTSGTLVVTARAVTAPSGIGVGPLTASLDLPLALSPDFPVLLPGRLELGTVTGTASAVAALQVIGSARGATRACVLGASLRSPASAGPIGMTPTSQCVTVPASTRRTLRVHLTPAASADGTVTGSLAVRLTSSTGEVTDVAVPTKFALARPVDAAVRGELAALFLAAALLIPLCVLWLANALVARFRTGRSPRVACVPVLVTDTGIRRLDGGRVLLDADDFTNLPVERPGRRLRLGPTGVALQRRLPWWPLRRPSAIATSSGAVLASSRPPFGLADPCHAPASLSPGAEWLLTAADTPEEHEAIRGHLVVLVDEGVAIADRIGQLAGFTAWEAVHAALLRGRATAAPRAGGAVTADPGVPVPVLAATTDPEAPPPPSWADPGGPPPPPPPVGRPAVSAPLPSPNARRAASGPGGHRESAPLPVPAAEETPPKPRF